MVPFAEVIGDPIAQSKSPAIHGFWLKSLGMVGDYRATLTTPAELRDFFASRRENRCWNGCNVTAPLKSDVIPFLDRIDPAAERIGAINCIVPQNGGLTGLNTDVDGIAEALAGANLTKVVLIGSGGAARGAASYLSRAGASTVIILARDPAKAAPLAGLGGAATTTHPLARAAEAVADATVVINASTLGMVGADPMPEYLLRTLASTAPGAVAFDMVTAPARTRFLQVAEANRLRTLDGLVMLIGQARRAFQLFFGASPPRERDGQLRHLLLGI